MGNFEMPPPLLKGDLGAELKDPRIERLGGFTEDRGARICAIRFERQRKITIRQVEIDIVKEVICVCAELKYSALAQGEAAAECQVCRGLAWSAIDVPS